jgi:MSHA biogenesis protein MshP
VIAPRSQRGFSLIAAVFLIVVLAALGTFAARIAMTQQQTVNLSVLEAQALAYANSGIEYGANRALKASICANSTTLTLGGTFNVKVTCVVTSHVASPLPKLSYALTSTATRGVYGRADFVSRQVARVVTTP